MIPLEQITLWLIPSCFFGRVASPAIFVRRGGRRSTYACRQPCAKVKYMLPLNPTVDLREYHDRLGRSPFREWRESLNPEARRRATMGLYRVGLGDFSNVQGVGAGVYECRINFGPGCRVYFGKDGEQIVILLGGGTKQRQ
jgi:putative addiction module killer protein